MDTPKCFSRRVLAAAASVKDQIDRCPLEWLSVEKCAKTYHVNRKELHKCFKQLYGKKIHEYQKLKVMDNACVMLLEGKMTIKEIAVELNYHKDYFSYIFKKQMGMTPTEWQKKEWEKETGLN